MTQPRVTRWSQRSVALGAAFLVCWQVAALAGVSRRAAVGLAVYGFVFHVVFGKAYSLVPSYFDRTLATPRLPAVQVPLTSLGAAGLAGGPLLDRPAVAAAGAVLWTAGALAFLAAVGWSIRDNLAGRETATGEANRDRRRVDRAANAFVPVALLYLLVGTYETLALHLPLPSLLARYPARVSHLLAAGTAALLVFAVGFRLLPRFMVAHPPEALVAVALAAGAVGPALVAVGLPTGPVFQAGAVVEAAAVVAFAAAVAVLYARSDRRRIGFYGVIVGAAAGVLAVLLGLSFAFDAIRGPLVTAHFRLNVLGFLGATIVGVAYQFYPPAVGTAPGAGDRTALASIGAIAAGLAVEVAGLLAEVRPAIAAGRGLALLGAALFAYLVVGLLRERGKL